MDYANEPRGTSTGYPDEEDSPRKIYVKLSLAKYPFLKSKKINEKGKATFKGEIEQSEKQEDGKNTHHTVCIQDLSSNEKARRV